MLPSGGGQATPDGSDVYPAWFANIEAWAGELHQSMGSPVQLELIQESRGGGIEIEDDGVIIADLFWRDATLNLPVD